MGSNDWIMPVVTIGGLAIGGILLLPTIMKSMKSNEEEDMEGYVPIERAEEAAKEAARAAAETAFRESAKLRTPILGVPEILRVGEDDDAYLITDEDFRKLDIGKKDRRWLNRQRKLRDARLERVVYGDNAPVMIPQFSGYVNTVSPYGQGPAREFTRLPGFSDQSRVNTNSSTINLY